MENKVIMVLMIFLYFAALFVAAQENDDAEAPNNQPQPAPPFDQTYPFGSFNPYTG